MVVLDFLKHVLICYIIVMHLHIIVLLSRSLQNFNCQTVQSHHFQRVVYTDYVH